MHSDTMVRGRSVVQETEGSEEDTTTNPSVALPLRLGLEITRLHYLFLVPLILLITPSRAILGMNLPVIGVLNFWVSREFRWQETDITSDLDQSSLHTCVG